MFTVKFSIFDGENAPFQTEVIDTFSGTQEAMLLHIESLMFKECDKMDQHGYSAHLVALVSSNGNEPVAYDWDKQGNLVPCADQNYIH